MSAAARRFVIVSFFVALGVLVVPNNRISAAPLGREWAEIQVLPQPKSFDAFVIPRLEMTADGSPLLIGGAIVNGTDGLDDGIGFRWNGAAWQSWWNLGTDPLFLWPVDAPSGRYPLIYTGGSYATNQLFYVTEVVNDQVVPSEIVAHVGEWTVDYAGAFREPRRWVAIQDRGQNRLFISDQHDQWNEVAGLGIGANGISLVALNDTTALMAWGTREFGLRWGVLRGSRWEPAEDLTHDFLGFPRLRAIAGGQAWLTWNNAEPGSGPFVRKFDGNAWSLPETLSCPTITSPRGIGVNLTDFSRDAAERPLVTWSYTNYVDGAGGVVVNFPNEHGWDPGDRFASSGYGAIPTIGRDRNGDAWVAWSESYEPFRFTHTHTSATTSAPTIEVDQGHPRLSWTLSTAAPETWWAVLRRKGAGNFESVARIQAGSGVAMSWTDSEAQLGWVQRDDISYRIRRESVDLRYEWLSPIARFTNGPKRKMQIWTPGFSDGTLTLDLSDALEPEVEVTIYSLAGRVVDHRTLQTGSGNSRHQLPLAPGLSAGVYFVQARVPSGAVSEASKFVLIR